MHISKAEKTDRITMGFLFKRSNRNRHFQVVKENRWLTKNRVFTGLGLYNEIWECGRIQLVILFEKEDRFAMKNFERNLKIRNDVAREILDCVIIGTNQDARKTKFGTKIVTYGMDFGENEK